MPHCGGHLSSFIQIPKLSERPWIVPHEVLAGLHGVTRASLVENEISFYFGGFPQAIDRIIDHLKLAFVAERPPPPQAALPELLWDADPSAGYFPDPPAEYVP